MRAAVLLFLLPACADPGGGLDAGGVPDAGPIDDCEQPIDCPPEHPGVVSICGRLHDIGSGAPLLDPELELSAYSALPYASTQDQTPPLAAAAIEIDACGRYVVNRVEEPMLTYIALVVDDPEGAPDLHAPTMRMLPAYAGRRLTGLRLAATPRATDQAWSASAGLTGATFAERGAVLALFLAGATPASGVVATADGSVTTPTTYYFADTDPALRTAPAGGLASTGANGAALITDTQLVDHSGVGGEPAGCTWSTNLDQAGGTLAGVIVYDELVAVCP